MQQEGVNKRNRRLLETHAEKHSAEGQRDRDDLLPQVYP